MAGWKGSTRKGRLPANWPSLRRQAEERAGGRCEMVEYGHRCTAVGTDCDHVEPGDDHSLENLQWLCNPHHLRKTGRDSWNQRRKAIAKAKARNDKRFGHTEEHSGDGVPHKHPWQR